MFTLFPAGARCTRKVARPGTRLRRVLLAHNSLTPTHVSPALSRACRVEQHGELGFECAEPYTLYGKALLNLAVTKSAVLGGGAPDKKDDQKQESSGPSRRRYSGRLSIATDIS